MADQIIKPILETHPTQVNSELSELEALGIITMMLVVDGFYRIAEVE